MIELRIVPGLGVPPLEFGMTEAQARAVHLATEDGSLHAFDAATGSVRRTVTLDEPPGWADRPTDEYFEPVTPFTLAGGVLYVNTDTAVVALAGW